MIKLTLPCGCEPDASGFGWCSECVRKLREKIWKELSAEARRYDMRVAPEQSAELAAAIDNYDGEAPTSCYCHINPPCGYCTRQNNENEEG